MKQIRLVFCVVSAFMVMACLNPIVSGPAAPTTAPSVPETADPVPPPNAPIVNAASPTNNLKPTWSWNVPEGAIGFQYNLDRTGWIPSTETSYKPTTDLSPGQHTFEVQAKNNSGVWSTSGSKTVLIDLSAPTSPTVTAQSPSKIVRPQWHWDIPVGSTALRYRLDYLSWIDANTSMTFFVPTEDLPEGDHVLEVQAINSLGNWSSPGTKTITIDLTPPTTPSISADSLTNNRKPDWSWQSPADGVILQYRLDGSTWIEAASATMQTFSPSTDLVDGTHLFELQVQDLAGNWSDTASKTVTVDTQPCATPTVTVITITNEVQPVWSWDTPIGAVAFRCQLDGGTWINAPVSNYSPTDALSSGTHTLAVQAADAAGNWSLASSATVLIDLTVPSSPSLSGISPCNTLRPTWSWTIPSGTTDIKYRLDTQSWIGVGNNTQSTFIPSYDLTEGNHLLEVQVRNAAGSWSESGVKIITIDITPPDAPILSALTPTDNFQPTWTWTIPDSVSAIWYRLDGGSWTNNGTISNAAYTPTTALSPGAHVFDVKASDPAGNESGIVSKTIIIAYLAPSNLVVSPLSNSVVSVTWKDNSTGESGFVIERKNDSGTYSVIAAPNANTTSWQNSGLAGNTLYTYRVKTAYSGAYSDYSSEVGVTTYANVNAPSNLSYTILDSNRILLKWTDNADNETAYKVVQVRGNFSDTTTLGPNANELLIYISANQYYTFNVYAYNAFVSSTSASCSAYFRIMEGPASLAASVDNTNVTLNWSDVSYEAGYHIERQGPNEAVFSVIASVPADTLSYADTSVAEGKKYLYRIVAYNDYSGTASPTATIQTDTRITSFNDTWYSAEAVSGETYWYSFAAIKDQYYTVEMSFPKELISSAYKANKSDYYFRNELAMRYTIKASNTEKIYLKCQPYIGNGTLKVIVRKSPVIKLVHANTQLTDGATLTLPSQYIGVKKDWALNIENDGFYTLKINSTTISGGDGSFSLDNSFLTSAIDPGSSGMLLLSLSSATAGPKTGTLYVSSNDPVRPFFQINLTAEVTGPTPSLTLSQDTTQISDSGIFSFGSVPCGSSKTLTFTITNTGQAALLLPRTPLISSAGQFTVNTASTAASIAPGDSSDFSITYNPTMAGLRTDSVYIYNNDPYHGSFYLRCQGTGLAGQLVLKRGSASLTSGQTIDFGTFFSDTTTDLVLSLGNSGDAPLQFQQQSISGPFLIQSAYFTTLAAGETKPFLLRLRPAVPGNISGVLDLRSNDPDTPGFILNLTAQSISGTKISAMETWYSGNIAVFSMPQWFYFDAVAGDRFEIYLDDLGEGSGTQTGDVKVSGYDTAFVNNYLYNVDSAYASPAIINVTSSGIVGLQFFARTVSSCGTFKVAIKKTN